MGRAAVIALGAVAAVAALLIPAAARAAQRPAEQSGGFFDLDLGGWDTMNQQREQARSAEAARDTNVRAFLALIAYAEGTDRAADPYRVCYSYKHTVRDLREHPAVSGEWRGERLSDAQCRGAGFGPGCVSTAAGRYQLIRPTWVRARDALGLRDFGPASQDAAAVYLIRQRGALDDVYAGRVAAAVAKCRVEWASLPGAGYGQPERQLAELLSAFGRAGGVVA